MHSMFPLIHTLDDRLDTRSQHWPDLPSKISFTWFYDWLQLKLYSHVKCHLWHILRISRNPTLPRSWTIEALEYGTVASNTVPEARGTDINQPSACSAEKPNSWMIRKLLENRPKKLHTYMTNPKIESAWNLVAHGWIGAWKAITWNWEWTSFEIKKVQIMNVHQHYLQKIQRR